MKKRSEKTYKQKEIWRALPEYEGLYEVSNLGNVKSLNYKRTGECKILLKPLNSDGYECLWLYKDFSKKRVKVHQLVAITFLGHTPCGSKLVVDHINNIRSDNRLKNLQIISFRENTSKDKINKTSKYTGVSWCKQTKKWRANIFINNKNKTIGRYKTEEEASDAYKDYLNTNNYEKTNT